MTPLVSICLVVITLSVVATAVALIRALMRVERATDQFTRLAAELEVWTVSAQLLTREAHVAMESFRGVIAPARRAADRFGALADRAASLSEVVLGEVESPIRTVVAAARSVKSITAFFVDRFSQRFTSGRSATQERSNHEPESAVQQ